MPLDRQPTRFNTEVTRVDIEQPPQGQWEDAEKAPRFSFNTDHSHKPTARRQNSLRVPQLKGPSPLPGSVPEYHDNFGDAPWRCGDPYRYNTPKKGDTWNKCYKLTEKYDKEMCDAWKEEVDNILIFAGLFSATVTAFAVESYKWLQEDAGDYSARLLAFIAGQVTNASNTIPSNLLPPPFQVSATDVRVNATWFLSLTLSLTTVLIGTVCLQWLREYQRDAALPHKEAVALRQMRYEGLLHWKVPQILSTLPLMLQGSLVLFFVGLLDLLWDRNTIVAAIITAAVGLAMIFLIAATVLPALQHAFTKDPHMKVYQCPYKSPQSWIAYRIGQAFFSLISKLQLRIFKDSIRFHRLLKSIGDSSWMTFDMRWRQYRDATEVYRGTAKGLKDSDDIVHGLQWLNGAFAQSVDAVYPIYHCLSDLELPAAAETISGFYLDGLIDNATLRVMLLDRFSPEEHQKKEILSTYYLHLHQDRHPVLKSAYLESLVRIMNTQDVPKPFYDWLSEILQQLASSLPSNISDSGGTFSILNPEITVQVLLCMKKLMAMRTNSLRTLDLVVAWALLHQLLSPSLSDTSEDELKFKHLRLACSLFEAFEEWVARGRELERCDRVKLCAEGMMTLFPSLVQPNMEWLKSVCPEMDKVASLVRLLDNEMESLGGVGVVIRREKRWWLDCWQVYLEEDWRDLVDAVESMDIISGPEV